MVLPEIAAVAGLGHSLVLDGELISGEGRLDDFYAVAGRLAGRRGLTFAAFDLLWLDGPLIARRYERRRAELEALRFVGPSWCTVPRWPAEDAVELFQACDLLGLEGIVVKRGRSRYRPGVRSNDWRKVKCGAWAEHRELGVAERRTAQA